MTNLACVSETPKSLGVPNTVTEMILIGMCPMLTRIFAAGLSCFFALSLSLLPAQAQNQLADGGFESFTAPIFGDNIGTDITPWLKSADMNGGNTSDRKLSVVKADGPGGNPATPAAQSWGGAPAVTLFPQADGSNNAIGHFLRNHASYGQIRVGQRVQAPYSGCVTFGGKFSTYSANNIFVMRVKKLQAGAVALLNGQASNFVDNFYPMTDPGWGGGLQPLYQVVTLPNISGWQDRAATIAVQQGETYAYMVSLTVGVAADDLFVRYVDNSNCPGIPAGTPNPLILNADPVLDAADVSLIKTCAPAVSTEQNGEVGLLWQCAVQVSVPDAPFSGSLSVTDAYTPIATTASDVTVLNPGHFTCAPGAICSINGADFDPSGVETLDFSVFVTATELQNSYPMQNCVEGSYDDGAGASTPVNGNCVAAQWIPRTETTKTCDPIIPVTSGPMTLTCHINVTGSDLATNSYVLAGDAFAALPPMAATIAGTMMNVTSSEPWFCVDANLNAPGSIGLCELSAADMLAAGGSSTLDISFEFTTDQTTGQLVNCPMTDILPGAYLAGSGLRRSAPMRSPQTNSLAGLPDNCVVLDLPQVTLPPKIEDVKLRKSCARPELATIQGVLGYTWDCQAEITVTPTPFAGTFTLEDDASNISIGAAQFLSASEPNCLGIGTDHLSCVLDGTTMSAPHTVSYQLFTALTDPNQPIEWKNCVKGQAETAAGVVPAVPMCVGRTIKPDVVLPPRVDPKEITLKKFCGRPRDGEQDGVLGKLWSCEVTVTATPAPFTGSFSFHEDASAVSGTSSANIIGYQSGNAAWGCSGSFPQPQTNCTIAGAAFAPSGVETISFDLFAADQGNAVKWQNCVSGSYLSQTGELRDVKGNCVGTDWTTDPKEPPVFSLKKGCRNTAVQNGNAYYACTIYVTQTSGAPITGPLTFDELFSTVSGATAVHHIAVLQGTPAAPNGWLCEQPPFANGASCTISAADFNGNTSHRIDAFIAIPTAVLAKDDFKNCAQVQIGNQVVGSADCVDIDEPAQETTFDVEKSCKPSGDRQILSSAMWLQPYQCTLTVTTNGVPFTGPLWITEDLHLGGNSGASLIQNITSADLWDCATPPYGAPGQGNTPYCGIQGNQFPASGTSTLTVDLMMNATMDMSGADNCVSLAVGEPNANGLPAPIASDCFEIAPAPTSVLDLVKTCAPAVRGANNLWTAQCQVTVSGTNLPAGHAIRITDALTGSGQTAVSSGAFDTSPFTGPNCGGSVISGGVGAACDLTTDLLNANGGSITLDYTAILMGAGLLNNAPGQNCASADITGLGLHAPTAGNGQSCVTIPLILTAVPGTGGVSVDPTIPVIVTPDGPVITGPIDQIGSVNPVIVDPVIIPVDPTILLVKTCEPAIAQQGGMWDISCQITVTVANLPLGEHIKIEERVLAGAGLQLLSGNMTGGGLICSTPTLCFIPTSAIGGNAYGPIGETYIINYSGVLFAPDTSSGAQNCARAAMFYNGNTDYVESPPNSFGTHGYCVPISFDQSTVTDPATGPTTGTTQSCGLDTLFVIDRSGSMAGTRIALTKQALISALHIFDGGGSTSGAISFSHATNIVGGASVLLPSPALEAGIQSISTQGATNWKAAMQSANAVVAGLTNKPLVLFISDGAPTAASGLASNAGHQAFTDAAIPYVTALRNQGSRVVGVTVGGGNLVSNMTRLLGANLTTASANTVVNPMTADVIEIPSYALIIPTFEQIALAYCPNRLKLSIPQKQALEAALQAMPKSAGAYMGDDELPVEQAEQSSVLPTPAPVLTIIKEKTGRCEARRDSQTYSCGFRLTVTNTGTSPYIGPLVLTDTAGNPGISSARLVAGNGWSCGRAVRNALSCTNAAVNLMPGASSHVDLQMKVKGLRDGGTLLNCASVGVPKERTQRVALIQKVMNDRGLKAGPVDGDPGNKTYAALAQLRRDLGLPASREFDDALFSALGLPLQKPDTASCVTVTLPVMPAPPLQCDAASTVENGESCACRYDNMSRRNATSCQCKQGLRLVKGKGCVAIPEPKPVPDTPALKCDLRSTYLRGDTCACIDHRNAEKISKTRCGCTNGLPMINGKCIPVKVKPEHSGESGADVKACRIKINGICIK